MHHLYMNSIAIYKNVLLSKTILKMLFVLPICFVFVCIFKSTRRLCGSFYTLIRGTSLGGGFFYFYIFHFKTFHLFALFFLHLF